MKNRHSAFPVLLALALFALGSCSSGIKESSFGNQYEHHVKKGGPTPQTGEYVEFHYKVRLDDSLVENSWERGEANIYKMPDMEKILADEGSISPVIDAISMMSEGDSMTIFNSVSSLPMVPSGFEGYQLVYYEVKLYDIMTEEEFQAAQEQKNKELEAQRAKVRALEADVAAHVADVLDRYSSGELADSLQTTASGLKYVVHSEGEGASPAKGEQVKVHYYGVLASDGTMFDNSFRRGDIFSFSLGIGQVIPGWDEGIALLKPGGKATLFIPSELGYGERGAPPTIPENADLVFYVELQKK